MRTIIDTLRHASIPAAHALVVGVSILAVVAGTAPTAQAQPTCTDDPPNWCVNPADYQFSMNVTAQLFFGGVATTDPADLVAAVVGGEIRGWASGSAFGNEIRTYLTVFSNTTGETVNFKIFDASLGDVRDITKSMPFVADGISGSPGNPITWNAPEGTLPAPIMLSDPTPGATNLLVEPAVDISWIEAPDADTYDLQIDNDLDFSSPLIDAVGLVSSPYAATGLQPTVTYYWRMRGTNIVGSGPWSASRSFTTASLTAPVLTVPAEAAADQPLSVELQWQSVGGATSYDVQLATDANFNDLVIETNTAATLFTAQELLPSTQYFWRVRSTDSVRSGPWSSSRSFTTASLAAPELTAPAEAAVDQPLSVRLRWQSVAGATSYEVQLATDADFNDVAIETNTEATLFTTQELQPSEQYFWRVRAITNTEIGPWASARSFTTITPTSVAAPELTAPNEAAADQPLSVELQWQTVGIAISYEVQLATDANFDDVVIETNTGATLFTAEGLLPSTQYFWRVRAVTNTEIGPWASARSFTTFTIAPSMSPTPSSPADGATTSGLTPTLMWASLDGATTYDVQLATDANFTGGIGAGKISSLIHEAEGLTDTRYTVPVGVLDEATTYFWRIRGVNSAGAGPWSTPRNFLTPAGMSPGAPSLLEPSDGALNRPVTVTLRWQAAADATVYTLQVATDDSFGAGVDEHTGLTATSIIVSDLVSSTVYYWRVQASNSVGVGPWSAVFRFKTLLTEPRLLDPANETMATTPPLLRWEAVTGAASYTLEVSEGRAFTVSVSYRGLTETSKQVFGLASGTVYYWRVQTVNVEATNAWSVVWTFTTLPDTGTAIEPLGQDHPERFVLASNYPNPFNPVTTIAFDLPASVEVHLAVFDALGREVAELVHARLTVGHYEVTWEAERDMTSGVYVYQLVAGGQVLTRTMLLLK